MNTCISKAILKGSSCLRLNRKESEALALGNSVEDVYRIGFAGYSNRLKRFGTKATFVSNITINSSNICIGKCSFCHFRVDESSPDAFILDENGILASIRRTLPSEVHIVGGMNRYWPFLRYEDLIRRIHRMRPDVYIKAFTAVEVDQFAKTEKKSVSWILEKLMKGGVSSLTGGGAELFSSRIRKKYCPEKLSSAEWLQIHRTAHRIGLTSNATMLYGLDERPEELVEHMLALRTLQDRTGGFQCFIPLAYQSKKETAVDSVSPLYSLKVIALARLVLDNIPHIKAYWPMIGLETASVGLTWGADDLDGTLVDEKIAHAGNAASPRHLSRNRMKMIIKMAGMRAVERAGNFRPVVRGNFSA